MYSESTLSYSQEPTGTSPCTHYLQSSYQGYSSKKEVHAILPMQCICNQKLWKRECETFSVAKHVRFPNRLQAPPTHFWRTNQPAEKILISKIKKSDFPIFAGWGVRERVHFTLKQSTKAPTVIICNLGAWCGWVVYAMPRPLYPRARNQYPLYRTLAKPQSRSGQSRNISPPPSCFDHYTLQSVSNCYNNYAIRPN